MSSSSGKVHPFAYIAAGLLVVGLIVLIVGLSLNFNCNDNDKSKKQDTASKARKLESLKEFCDYSPEAQRIGLKPFLTKVQKSYFEQSPHQVAYQPDIKDMSEHVKTR